MPKFEFLRGESYEVKEFPDKKSALAYAQENDVMLVMKMSDYTEMTTDEFDAILQQVVKDEGAMVLTIPEVYAACVHYYNDEVLDRWKVRHDEQQVENYRAMYSWEMTEEDKAVAATIPDDAYFGAEGAVCECCPVNDNCPFDHDLTCKRLFDKACNLSR